MGITRVVFVPVKCPRCGKRGEPARTPPCRPGEWEAELKCPACGHLWIAKMRGYRVPGFAPGPLPPHRMKPGRKRSR